MLLESAAAALKQNEHALARGRGYRHVQEKSVLPREACISNSVSIANKSKQEQGAFEEWRGMIDTSTRPRSAQSWEPRPQCQTPALIPYTAGQSRMQECVAGPVC